MLLFLSTIRYNYTCFEHYMLRCIFKVVFVSLTLVCLDGLYHVARDRTQSRLLLVSLFFILATMSIYYSINCLVVGMKLTLSLSYSNILSL
jgi:hypothetical protein